MSTTDKLAIIIMEGVFMMENAIEIKNVTKVLGGKKILNNISFNVRKNTIVGLVGPNGAGKSTLLKIMTGLYTLDVGEIYYDGISLKKDYELAMRNIGCIIESPDMYKNLSGSDNLDLFKLMFKGVSEETVKGIVQILDLEKSIGRKFKTYSLGMKERLGVASSLLGNPKILILDEPTNGLDPISIRNLRTILKNLKDTTIVISSHLLSEIELICDEVIFINNGEIIERKDLNSNESKKYVEFEVDNYLKAKLLLNNFSINDSLCVYATDDEVSNINRDFVINKINVFRISEKKRNLEEEFIEKMASANDKIN